MITSNNALLTALVRLSLPQIVATATKYGITQLQSCSISDIERHMFLAHFL